MKKRGGYGSLSLKKVVMEVETSNVDVSDEKAPHLLQIFAIATTANLLV
ncbi:MAG: hypothetical protein HN501_00395 [Waddliaceae bacterium]|nr:hypothetical protein [Waddliaceae bacterium]MBT4445114.1 hypothetical protein [Waddliaceae bacterium]MBT7264614.1 hypothetical protein [Waddliaceae bacterium]